MDIVELCHYVEMQVERMLCFSMDLSPYIDIALNRTQKSLSASANKYTSINNSNKIPFSIYNSVQYSIFLYFLSNTVFTIDGNGKIAEKIYYLNKILHSIDIFYEVKMPDTFGCEHPLGSVMGRANYSNKFFFYQGCTVGGSGGYYPIIGENVLMYSNSKVLGKCNIGSNVVLAANSYIIDCNIPDNCIVFGQSPNNTIKTKKKADIIKLTRHIWR